MEPVNYIAMSSRTDAARNAVLTDAVSRMVSVSDFNGRFVIDMPLVTCGGNGVSVSVWPQDEGKQFIVSDDGRAFFESDAACCNLRTFAAIAKERASVYGAKFDGHTLLFLKVTADKLRGAIVAMANLVKEVVDMTAEKSSKDHAENSISEFRDLLGQAFGASHVHKDAELIGDSTAAHKVAALVETNNGKIAFDDFSGAGVSINAIYTKFSDISRKGDGPKLVAVTKNPDAIGPKLSLVSSVAAVIKFDSPKERLLRLVA